MKVNMTTVLTGLDGQPLPDGDNTRTLMAEIKGRLVTDNTPGAIDLIDGYLRESEPLNLRSVLCNVLMAQFKDEEHLDGKKKVERWQLAQKVFANDEVDLTSDEVTLSKGLVAKAYAPVVVGPVWAVLDPAAVGAETE